MHAGFGRGLLLRMQQSANPATAQMNPTKAEPATAACSNHDGVTFPRMAACFFLVALRAFFLLPGNNLRVLGSYGSLDPLEGIVMSPTEASNFAKSTLIMMWS
jgi:hypothetical protein